MDIEKLNAFNKVVIGSYDTFKYPTALDIVLPGMFKGNNVMFIVQHIDNIVKDSDVDRKHYDEYIERNREALEEYASELYSDENSINAKFIADIYGKDLSNVSITSVFKCPFIDNVIPDELTTRELSILEFQIKLVKPKIIVAIGSVAMTVLKELQMLNQYTILKTQHPSQLIANQEYNIAINSYKTDLFGLIAHEA